MSAPYTGNSFPALATRLSIQCQPSGSAEQVYVFFGFKTVPSTGSNPYLTLAQASATAGGDTYSDRVDQADDSGIDLSQIWIDGAHSGDVVTWTANLKI